MDVHTCICAGGSKILKVDTDFRDVKEAVYDARRKYYQIGLELGLKQPDVKTIATQHGNDYDQGLDNVLVKWMNQRNLIPTWKSLSKALRSPLVDEESLADDIDEAKMLSTRSLSANLGK